MVTLQDINQFAVSHKIDSNTDVFSILSMMQLEARKVEVITPAVLSSSETKVEFSVQDVLDLFNS